MPAAPASSRPARWRNAIVWLSEVLNFVSSLALIVLIAVVVRDQALSPAFARVILLWGVAAAILTSVFTRWIRRSPAFAESQPDTPAI